MSMKKREKAALLLVSSLPSGKDSPRPIAERAIVMKIIREAVGTNENMKCMSCRCNGKGLPILPVTCHWPIELLGQKRVCLELSHVAQKTSLMLSNVYGVRKGRRHCQHTLVMSTPLENSAIGVSDGQLAILQLPSPGL